MNLKRTLLLLLVIPLSIWTAISFSKIQELQQALEKSKADEAILQTELQKRLSEIQTSKKEMAALNEQLVRQLQTSEPASIEKPQARSDSKAPELQAAQNSKKSLTWRSNQAVNEIDEEIALDEKQKETLNQKFQDFFEKSGKSFGATEYEQAKQQILEDILGPELANNYRVQRAKSLEKEFQEKIDQEVIVLSSKLSLSPDQQILAKKALVEINHQLIPEQQAMEANMRDAMATHFEGDSAREKLQTQYDQIKQQREALTEKRRKALFEALQNSLSDQQKNDLLSIQSEK